MKTNIGFTLIELLVTITIIGILATIGLITYSAFLKAGRDTQRQSDLRQIQSALEEYHADQKYYPVQSEVTFGSSLSFGSKTYLTKLPNDPIKNPDYSYIPSPSGCTNSGSSQCISYCLFAHMENSAPPSDQGCSPSGSYNFGLTRP